MRIADILVTYATERAYVVDLTDEDAGLSPYATLAPAFGLPYQRGVGSVRDDAKTALVLHSLAGERDAAVTSPDLSAFHGLAESVIHIVFLERLELLIEHGLLEQAASTGFELVSTHGSVHRAFPFAVVLRRPSEDTSSARLRIVNEYRFDKLRLDELERIQARTLRQRDELGAKADLLAKELSELRARHQETSRAHREAVAEVAQHREQLQLAQKKLLTTFEKLETARRSISFRIGSATKAAVDQSRKNVLTAPRRWLERFRGPDAIVEDLRPGIAAVAKPAKSTRQ